jgi:hypothetical protein
MKKLSVIFLLVLALVLSACTSEDSNENLGLLEVAANLASVDDEYAARNDMTAAEPAPGYEEAYIIGGGGGVAMSEPEIAFYSDDEVLSRDFAVSPDGAPPVAPAARRSETDDSSAVDGDVVGDVGAVSFTGFDSADVEYYLIDPPISISPPEPQPQPQPQAGLLTAGEWNDNSNWDFWNNLMGQNRQFSDFAEHWQLFATRRYVVKVIDENGSPIRGAEVSITGFKAITDHEGIAYIFRALNPNLDFNSPTIFTVSANGETQTVYPSDNETVVVFEGARSPAQLKLDLMFVIDTTGSMGDELHYLQTELDYVISSVSRNNANLPLRLSVNFYRDIGDEYVVRPFTFSTDIAAQLRNLAAQNAAGGGDRPEAVDAALQNAIHEHTWLDDSVKLMFIVLDAPPHHNQTTIPAMSRLAAEAAAKGIRIIPLLASDGCTETEFLMRVLAMTTGGTYTFVTGHSGISTGRHVEPTIGDYNVEKLNELLIKIINRYLA